MDEGNEVKGLPKVAQKIQGHLKDLQPEPASPVAGWSRELQDQEEATKMRGDGANRIVKEGAGINHIY